MSTEVIDFRTRTFMPDVEVDILWEKRPGFLDAALRGALADIHMRLRKRYAVPFAVKPEIVCVWQAALVTPTAYRALGYQPGDSTIDAAEKDRERAYEQIKEAADAHDGLFDLPLADGEDTSAVSKGGPLGYSEPSPYDWGDVQRESLLGR